MPNGHPESDHHIAREWAGKLARRGTILIVIALMGAIGVNELVPDSVGPIKDVSIWTILYSFGGVGVGCIGLAGVLAFLWAVSTWIGDEDD